jgi:Asp-tRNA(Asn)/Glu-tRNA(Gln) amidotransferase C subunit
MDLTDLHEVADLARLPLSEHELQSISPVFNQMLSFFATMQAADGDASMPDVNGQADFTGALAQPVSPGHIRPDAANGQGCGQGDIESMLSQAPERDGNFIVIPNVL